MSSWSERSNGRTSSLTALPEKLGAVISQVAFEVAPLHAAITRSSGSLSADSVTVA